MIKGKWDYEPRGYSLRYLYFEHPYHRLQSTNRSTFPCLHWSTKMICEKEKRIAVAEKYGWGWGKYRQCITCHAGRPIATGRACSNQLFR